MGVQYFQLFLVFPKNTVQSTFTYFHMPIKLNKDVEQRLSGSIQRYFAENMEEEIGDLGAKMLLDFFVKEVGPSVYNQAVLDAQAVMQDRVAELDTTCYETEFEYWKK